MKNGTNAIAVITPQDLALVDNNLLNTKQAQLLLSPTPPEYLKKRKGKGGKMWDYVSGGYVKNQLNLMFGWDWDFEIMSEIIEPSSKQVIVKGKLTCRINDRAIVKMQYGRCEIKYWAAKDEQGNKTSTNEPLDLGNDLKAAATDCLKKCASEIGIAADIYNKDDFREAVILDDDPEVLRNEIMEMWTGNEFKLNDATRSRINAILDKKEVASYPKVLKHLKQTVITKEPIEA